MTRLNAQLLPQLTQVMQPQYQRDALQVGIVHLGIGAFHRAHQAFYTEQVMNLLGGDWGIVGCSLRSDSVRQQLAPQDSLYTLLVRGERQSAQVIGAVTQVLVGPENSQAIVDAIAAANVQVVSLTVTEKGYCHRPADGTLDLDHADIQHDLNHPHSPRSAIGYLIAGLNLRRREGVGGVTLLSCDNLPHNGRVLRAVVSEFAERISPELAAWVQQNVRFPSTMVDRIVPATTERDIQALHQTLGYEDHAMVVAEPFSQWVIEDDFAASRPAWERVGALLVKDVAPYETMKLRLLNGSHSLLAYLGYLAGCETVHQVMQNPRLVDLCRRFMAAAATTLEAPPGFDIQAYQTDLIARFANPGLQHRTWQIAMDGSQKLPQRWLQTLRTLLVAGRDCRVLALGLAAWMRYVRGIDETGQTIEIADPMRDSFRQINLQYGDNCAAYVSAMLALKAVFGTDLAERSRLVEQVQTYLSLMLEQGVMAAVSQCLDDTAP